MIRNVSTVLGIIVLMTAASLAQTAPVGSGPYPAVIEGDPGVPGHTIYRPNDLAPFNRENSMPVIAWGNGGCANSSQMHANFLAEIASHGFLVVAIGPYVVPGGEPATGGVPGGMGGTKSAQLLEALDWATAESRRSGSKYYGKVDPSKFAAMGMSCGGLQALEVSPDPRVTTSVIMNSGILNAPAGAPGAKAPAPKEGTQPKMRMSMPAVNKELLKKLHAPIFYVIGGEKDIAYPNAVDDFARIESVPVAMANLDVGHGGTYHEPNGGKFGIVAVAWLKWQLKGDQTAKKMFAGPDCGLCKDAEWTYEQKKIS
ncbi:MAG TPA: alpha/beta hydrolase [Acidobacteriota bacterium]|nr:alpha/beta hydrolase [Acidobacteriota bacterium]